MGLARGLPEQQEYDATVSGLRDRLGEANFVSAWSQGLGMSMQQALALAAS